MERTFVVEPPASRAPGEALTFKPHRPRRLPPRRGLVASFKALVVFSSVWPTLQYWPFLLFRFVAQGKLLGKCSTPLQAAESAQCNCVGILFLHHRIQAREYDVGAHGYDSVVYDPRALMDARPMKSREQLLQSNLSLAKNKWGELPKSIMSTLEEILLRYGLSVGLGDLLYLDGRWYAPGSCDTPAEIGVVAFGFSPLGNGSLVGRDRVFLLPFPTGVMIEINAGINGLVHGSQVQARSIGQNWLVGGDPADEFCAATSGTKYSLFA